MTRSTVEQWRRDLKHKNPYEQSAECVKDMIGAFEQLIDDWLHREWAMRESISKLRYYADCSPTKLDRERNE